MMIKGSSIVANDAQSPADSVVLRGKLTAATTTAVGGVIKVQNDLDVDLMVTGMYVDVTTKSSGAATLDVGVDYDGDVSNDTLFDGLDVGTAAGFFNTAKNGGTNGKAAVLWKRGEYVVASASATVAGLVGKYTIVAIPRAV